MRRLRPAADFLRRAERHIAMACAHSTIAHSLAGMTTALLENPMQALRITAAMFVSVCFVSSLIVASNARAQTEPTDHVDAPVNQETPNQTAENPFSLQLNLDFTNAYFY